VIFLNVMVPTQNKQRMLKAIRYANEEDIATDVEELHFALAKIESKDRVSVAVVEISLMDQWQQMFQTAGLSVDVMMPESLAVPYDENELNIVVDDNIALVRHGNYQAFFADLNNLNLMLSLWIKDNAEQIPKTIKVWGNKIGVVNVSDEIEVEHKITSNGVLGLLDAQPIDLDKTINFLQGDYSRREQIGKIWRPWRLAASLAGALFIIQIGVAIVQSSALETQKNALKAEAKQIYKTTFPKAKRIVNPKKQMQTELKKLKGGGASVSVTFLTILSGTAKIFSSTSGLNLKSIRFKKNVLDVELEVPNYQVLDQLKQKLTKAGERSVEIQSAVTRDNIVHGRLQIKGLSS